MLPSRECRRKQRALVAGLALLVGAGCGGKAGEDNEAPRQDPSDSAPGEGEPERSATGSASTSSDDGPAAESEPAATPGVSLPAEEELPLATRYTNARRSTNDFLGRYCATCHSKSDPASPCGLRFDDTDDLVAVGLLVPLSFEMSPVIRVMLDGSMPPPGAQPRPSTLEIEGLRSFIDNPAFWSSNPPDGHSMVGASIDAANNACD